MPHALKTIKCRKAQGVKDRLQNPEIRKPQPATANTAELGHAIRSAISYLLSVLTHFL